MARQDDPLTSPVIFTLWLLISSSLLSLTEKSVNGARLSVPQSAVEEFVGHERVVPVIYSRGRAVPTTLHFSQTEHLSDVTVVIPTSKKNFTLDLKINGELLSSSYVRRRPHPGGYHIHRPSTKHKSEHCFYHGHIRGDRHSMAALSTCQGISGFWSDDHEFYHLEPLSETQGPAGSGSVHLLYRDSDRRPHNYSCGYSHKHDMSPSEQTRRVMRRVKRSIYGPYDSNEASRYVELYLVIDHTLAQRRTVRQLESRAKEITNIVSRLYKPLNIYVGLVGVEVWDQTDLISITSDPNTTLDNFLRYRRERINPNHPNDNAQLLTGVKFGGGVVGKAVKGPICTFQFSGGVNMDYSSLVAFVATTVAHELGHNFGMHHDNDTCVCPQDRCIMASISGSASPTLWSSCSKQALQDTFKHGMDYCLRNKPRSLYKGPVCGNGFVEDREECDCGLPESCDSQCCNATTCTLLPNAVCATGECCDKTSCMPKALATECRSAKGECDFAEYCNGKSEFCPDDVFVANGHQCQEGAAYCYKGKCSTHTDQCQLLWGPTGKTSNSLCYRKLNIEGRSIGNCGFNWITEQYSRCPQKDVMCGMLQCVHLNEKLVFWKDMYARNLPATFIEMSRGNKKYVCRGAVLDVGLDMPDPGMVPDGASCGTGKMCVSQQCRAVEEVWTRPADGQQVADSSPCSSMCNGHGTCNTKGNCHCDPGYAHPFCAESGEGCSKDSGPCRLTGDLTPQSPDTNRTTVLTTFSLTDKSGLLAGLLVLFLLIIPLIILLIVAYFKREPLKKWWKTQTIFVYSGNSTSKPPPQPSVRSSPSVKSSDSTRENKFRSVSFRTGDPPSISGPVLTSSTNRNSQALTSNLQTMETFKPPDENDRAPIYGNVPPPRPPPMRPRSLHEEAAPDGEFTGVRTSVGRNISLRAPEKPPPPPHKVPTRAPTNRQRDIMQLQDSTADKHQFENSRLALKPTFSRTRPAEPTSPPKSPETDDMLVSALKARFDSSTDAPGRSRTENRGGASRGRADAATRGRSNSGSRGRGDSANRGRSDSANRGRSDSANRGRSDSANRGRSDSANRGRGDSGSRDGTGSVGRSESANRGRGRGRGGSRPTVTRTASGAARPPPPTKPPPKPTNYNPRR